MEQRHGVGRGESLFFETKKTKGGACDYILKVTWAWPPRPKGYT